MAQATVLKPGQYRHLIRVTRATSRAPERDILVLMMGVYLGMRVSEIAQVKVGDFMFACGELRQEVSLRAVHASFLLMDSTIPLETTTSMLWTCPSMLPFEWTNSVVCVHF